MKKANKISLEEYLHLSKIKIDLLRFEISKLENQLKEINDFIKVYEKLFK